MSGQLSGLIYVALSGNVTIKSGVGLSGWTGAMDGMPLAPGDSYFIPRLATGGSSGTIASGGGFSGQTPPFNVWVTTESTGSGQNRLFWEVL
jgi:hypothetical protein